LFFARSWVIYNSHCSSLKKFVMAFFRLLFWVGVFFLPLVSAAQSISRSEHEIRKVLANQVDAWNRGDLEGFMQGYWNNDSLLFIGKSGFTYGWAATLANYRKGYPDTVAMGQLRFELREVRRISSRHYFVAGKWFLARSGGNAGGAFTLLFRKIGGRWYVVADHSS
jgi:ketosteroid isomerase-like protein